MEEVIREDTMDGLMEARMKIRKRVMKSIAVKINCSCDQNNRDQRGRGGFCGTCFHYKEWHEAYECPRCWGKNQCKTWGKCMSSIKALHFEYVDRGEVLIIKRALLSDKNELEQRKILFRTRWKCNSKVCNVIIDSGRMNNLIFDEMVNKLRLQRKKHLNPYWISWL